MRVKVIKEVFKENFEHAVNDFIEGKEIIDIKFSIEDEDFGDKYYALIMYE